MEIRPPVVALLWLGSLAGADWVLPVEARRQLRVPRSARWAGAAPFVAGVALAGWAIGLFRKEGTTPEPFDTPSALVASGPYRYTRNPMYVGVLLSMTGVALASGRALLLLAPLGFFGTMSATQIPREERLLEREFGQSYRDYRQRVRRWL